MMTTSLFKLPESISGVNDEGEDDGGDIPGANVDVSAIRSNKKYIKFFGGGKRKKKKNGFLLLLLLVRITTIPI